MCHPLCVYIYIYIFFFFFLWRCDPTRVLASSFLRFSRSHTTTHHSRQDSSGRAISSSQRPLPDNIQHSQQTSMPRWDSNLRSQQESSRRPTPQTARLLGPAYIYIYIYIERERERRRNVNIEVSFIMNDTVQHPPMMYILVPEDGLKQRPKHVVSLNKTIKQVVLCLNIYIPSLYLL